MEGRWGNGKGRGRGRTYRDPLALTQFGVVLQTGRNVMISSEPPCRLCGQLKPLQESHIIPALAIRWLVETSATGFVRDGERPALRVQDGRKEYMLCASCEQEFGRQERHFSNRLFLPFNSDPAGTYRYGIWLERFCVSVSWRVLQTFYPYIAPDGQLQAQKASQRWRDYLMYRKASPGIFRQHIVPLHPVGDAAPYMPQSINRYLLRAIEAEYIGDGENVMTYAKVGRFAIFGLITQSSVPWDRTRVGRTGAILPRRTAPPSWMLRFFSDRARVYQEAWSEIPKNQHRKIEATLDQDMSRAVASASAEAMRHDARLFGREAVTRKPRT